MAMQGCNNTGAWGAGLSGRQARRAIQLGTTRCALGSRSAARRVSLRLLFVSTCVLIWLRCPLCAARNRKQRGQGARQTWRLTQLSLHMYHETIHSIPPACPIFSRPEQSRQRSNARSYSTKIACSRRDHKRLRDVNTSTPHRWKCTDDAMMASESTAAASSVGPSFEDRASRSRSPTQPLLNVKLASNPAAPPRGNSAST